MKLQKLLCATLVCPLALVAGQGQTKPAPTAAASDIPHLRKQGTATQLIVDGKPFLALGGELSNNSATSVEYMKRVWPRLVAGQNQHRPGGRFLEPDRTAGREVRLQRAGRRDPGCTESQPASRAFVVRELEERSVQLPARLGEEGLRAVPARPDRKGARASNCSAPQRCEPGRRCPRLCGPDAARQGSGWPAAHGHHDPGGERSGNAWGHPRPLARGQSRLSRGRCRRS